jgi:uncharacterized protein (DUF488 family)
MTIYTVGHSTYTIERLIKLLQKHEITAVGDVRSQPYSRTNPQFNREPLKDCLKKAGIAYVFLGEELGARSDDPSCYVQGKISYSRLAESRLFQRGLERVRQGAREFRLALMCAEKEPLDCHRTILVARHLENDGVEVRHILEDGSIELHRDSIDRLKRQLKLAEDMFKSKTAVEKEAYDTQGSRIAYKPPSARHAIGRDPKAP